MLFAVTIFLVKRHRAVVLSVLGALILLAIIGCVVYGLLGAATAHIRQAEGGGCIETSENWSYDYKLDWSISDEEIYFVCKFLFNGNDIIVEWDNQANDLIVKSKGFVIGENEGLYKSALSHLLGVCKERLDENRKQTPDKDTLRSIILWSFLAFRTQEMLSSLNGDI